MYFIPKILQNILLEKNEANMRCPEVPGFVSFRTLVDLVPSLPQVLSYRIQTGQ